MSVNFLVMRIRTGMYEALEITVTSNLYLCSSAPLLLYRIVALNDCDAYSHLGPFVIIINPSVLICS
jgi:hypothetical protein